MSAPSTIGGISPTGVARILPEHIPPDKLTIIVFGPGHGESILVSLPNGRFGVVDGCGKKNDPVLELLAAVESQTGNDREQLAFICLTHPHLDHYGGLGQLIDSYARSLDRICTLNMMSSTMFASKLKKHVELQHKGDPTQRYCGLLDFISSTEKATSQQNVELQSLSSHMPIPVDGHTDITISCCAPSGGDVNAAQRALLEVETGQKKTKFDPNRVSAVLTIRWESTGILLAGDLICNKSKIGNSGWCAANKLVTPPIQLVKIAHHGSGGACYPDLWKNIGKPSLGLITPFQQAKRNQPPRRKDLKRLASLLGNIVVTTPPDWLSNEERTRANLPVRRDPKSRKSSLRITAPPTANDRHNAVAVTLDSNGNIEQLYLAGHARLYDPDGCPTLRGFEDH